MKNSEIIGEFLTFLRRAEMNCNIASSRQSDADMAIQDILHRLELCDDDYHSSAKLAKALRKLRRERRTASDEYTRLEPIVKWVRANKPCIKSLEILLGDARKAERATENRHYNNRTDVIKEVFNETHTERHSNRGRAKGDGVFSDGDG